MTEPDFNLMPSILDFKSAPGFDPQGIADAVQRYQAGETKMVYNEDERSEKLAEFLMQLLNRDGEQAPEQ